MRQRTSKRTSGVYSRHRTNVREMCSTPLLKKQVQRSRDFVISLFYLWIMVGVTSALPSRPRIIDDNHNRTMVIFNNQPCRHVDAQHLQLRMGRYFDESRMALDEATVKRSVLQEQINTDKDIGDYSDDFEDDNDVQDSDDDSDSQTEILSYTEDPLNPNFTTSQNLMRRKRDVDLEEDGIDDGNNVNDFRSGNRKHMEPKTMKKLKKFMKKSKKLKKVKKLPWTCKMKRVWLKMEEGYFPQYVHSAECQSKKCFYNLYGCIPKKYTIKILRRDPNRCNPLPTYGVNTTYEEMWLFDRYHVTVWCECGNTSRKNRRRGRWKDKGKSRFRSRP